MINFEQWEGFEGRIWKEDEPKIVLPKNRRK